MGTSPSAVVISPDGSLAYVANGPDTVSVIDTKTYTVIPYRGDRHSRPRNQRHVIALSPDGSRICITDAYDRWVSLLAPASTAAPAVGTPAPTTGAVSGALNVKDPTAMRSATPSLGRRPVERSPSTPPAPTLQPRQPATKPPKPPETTAPASPSQHPLHQWLGCQHCGTER